MGDVELEDEDLRAALIELRQYVDVTEEDLKKIFSAAVDHAKKRIAQKTPVRDVMTLKVITVEKEATVQEVARLLSENRVSGVPVVDEDGRVIGVVSEADILHTVGVKKGHTFRDVLRHLLGEPLPSRQKGDKVKNIMTAPAITTTPEIDIKEVAKILDEKRIKRLPVVDDEEKLIGIISRANLVKFMGGG